MVKDAIFAKLVERHTHATENRRNVPDPLSVKVCFQASKYEVRAAISCFPAGSAGGPMSDLLKPALLTEIMTIINLLLQGNCTSAVLPIYSVEM